MRGKKRRGLKRRIIKSDRKINKKNKNLMIDKILSYNPMLLEGIEEYKDANRNFTLLIFLGALLIDFPLISVPCCILSILFVIKMLQYIRYKSINNIVNQLAKDLSFKGIYNKEKARDMLDDFKSKYGDDIVEYDELASMLDKYESLVTKIAYVLRNVKAQNEKKLYSEESLLKKEKISFIEKEKNITCEEVNLGKQYKSKGSNNYYIDFNEKLSVLYKKEDGEVRAVNKAIEFFEDDNNEISNNSNAVMLKNINKDKKNLTVYLYKKTSDLQKDAL